MRPFFSFFHFVLIKPEYGVLSDPPIVVSRHKSRGPLVTVFRNNESTGVLRYDCDQGLYQTTILKDKKKLFFPWPHSSVLDRFIDPSCYLKLDIHGTMVRLDVDSGQKEEIETVLRRGDYLTCADFWRRKGLAVSFENHFFLFDGEESMSIKGLSFETKQYLYATKIRSFWQGEGPVHVLIRFQRGGFIYLRFLDVNALKDVKILEKTMFTTTEDAIDFDLDDRFIYVLDKKKRLVLSSLKDREKTFIVPLGSSFSAICVRNRKIHLFDPQSTRWSTISPSTD